VVALVYLHNFHRFRIQTWGTDGDGETATCPYCRLELCTRPAQPNEEDTAFRFDDGTDLDDWEEGWEGLDDGFSAMTEDELEVVGRLIDEDRMSGTDFNSTVCRILAIYNARPPSTTRSFERPLVPGSVQEYMVVSSIVEGLWVAYPLVGRSNSKLNTAEMACRLRRACGYEEYQ
jgi:hypothetical protein